MDFNTDRPRNIAPRYYNDNAAAPVTPTPAFTEARFRARKANPVTVTSAGSTSIQWDTILEQLNVSYNAGNGTVTIDEPGIYLISASVGWQFNASATQAVSVFIIGPTSLLTLDQKQPLASPFSTSVGTSLQIRFAAGDTVQISASQSNAGALTRDFGQFPATATYATNVCIEKLAD